MRFSVPILKLIKESGVVLVTRIAGLLLSAIAVQMIADAVRAFIAEGWATGPLPRHAGSLPRPVPGVSPPRVQNGLNEASAFPKHPAAVPPVECGER